METSQGVSLIHVEAQTVYDIHIPERMAEYGARLWMAYRLPVTSYVLLLTRRGLPARAPTAGRIIAGDAEIKIRYRLVRLWQVSARRVLAMKRENLLPFVPLMRGGQEELEAGAEHLGEITSERKQEDLSLHFLLLGGLRYNREDLLDLIGRESMIPLEQLKESSFYQYIIEEGLKEGREQGIQQGIQQGREQGIQQGREQGIQQGEAEGFRKALHLIVSKRFPNLDVDEEISRIRDFAVLQQLCEEAMDAPDAASFKKRLADQK